ncbi:MAG TPA: Gfo/Idh/MocA family oxidoreductase [Chloroflexota bacterium]
MNGKVRVAIIGAGSYAEVYHIPALLEHPDAALVALCRHDAGKLSHLASRLGVQRTSTDYREIVDQGDLDAVVISSPHGLHYEHARYALERGLHVLLDKHMVLRTAQALDLLRLARERKVVFGVAYNRHLDPANLYARRLIRDGVLGDLVFARALQLGYPSQGWYTTKALGGGGPFVGRGSHMADLIRWYVGWRPVTVTATVRQGAFEVDDGGVFTITFENGFQCSVASLRDAHRDVDEMAVYGTAGAVVVSRPLGWQYRWWLVHYGRGGEVQELPRLPEGSTSTANFIDAVLGRDELKVPAEDGVYAVQIIEAAYRSAESGRSIALEPLDL